MRVPLFRRIRAVRDAPRRGRHHRRHEPRPEALRGRVRHVVPAADGGPGRDLRPELRPLRDRPDAAPLRAGIRTRHPRRADDLRRDAGKKRLGHRHRAGVRIARDGVRELRRDAVRAAAGRAVAVAGPTPRHRRHPVRTRCGPNFRRQGRWPRAASAGHAAWPRGEEGGRAAGRACRHQASLRACRPGRPKDRVRVPTCRVPRRKYGWRATSALQRRIHESPPAWQSWRACRGAPGAAAPGCASRGARVVAGRVRRPIQACSLAITAWEPC